MSEFQGFPRDTIDFLADLADPEKNNKAWFDANRSRYEDAWVAPSKAFVTAVGTRLHAELSPEIQAVPGVRNGSMMRVNRDIRFSKDKRPYKDHLDLWFWVGSGKGMSCPGLGFRLTHQILGTGGGMHGMDKALLAAYRTAVIADPTGSELAKLAKSAEAAGHELWGRHYKTVPRGFDKEHPRADLLKFKGIWFSRETAVPDALHTPAIVDLVVERFRPAWPLVRWLAPLAAASGNA